MKFLKGLNVAAVSVCIGITALNQYVTHTNAQLWLNGQQYNVKQAEQNAMVYELEMAYDDALTLVDKVLGLADSERIRAERLQYERDRARDAAVLLERKLISLLRICEEYGIPPDKLTLNQSQ